MNPCSLSPLRRPRPRPNATTRMILLAAVLALLSISTRASAAATAGGGAQRGSVLLSGSPGVPVANPATDTVYVPIQCKASFCSTPQIGDVVDVINAARCNANVVSGCRVVAQITVGKAPLAAVLDARTDTIYTVNAGTESIGKGVNSGTVSVFNGARCNANVTSGCTRALATITTGGSPVAGAFDPETSTLYVASLTGGVFVINLARCNAITTTGCRQHVREVKDSGDPDAVDVDVATDTVYAANDGASGNGDTVSVINGATCNASDARGCGQTPRTITVGHNPEWDVVDQATDIVYVANANDGTVSVINGARCNATVNTGCKHPAPAVTTGAGVGFVAVDDSLHTVFAMNSGDDTLSAIDTTQCRATHTAGCPKLAPAQQAGSNEAPGYGQFPNQFALIPRTGSAYIVNEGGSDVLTVVDFRHCDAIDTSACRVDSASVARSEYTASIDPRTDTIYASNFNLPQIDVLNGATCDAKHLSGCAPVAEIPIAHSDADLGAIDATTNTLYASDAQGSTISVIDTATCNAIDAAGCAKRPPTITVGAAPGTPVLNPATETLYAPVAKSASAESRSQIAVIDAATCNAQTTAGCGAAPAVIGVGQGTNQLAVSVATDTIYAPSSGSSFSGDTVAVINGATCNGTDHAGCGKLAATVKVGLGPSGVAADDLTHTVYVANNADGDTPATVSVINSATCNSTDAAGCSGPIPAIPVGRSPLLVAADTATDQIYVTNYSSATVSIIDGSTCNATITLGCAQPAPAQAVGSQPFGLALNDSTNTVYALTQLGGGAISIFGGSP